MGDVRSFEDFVIENTPHETAELICLCCHERWIGMWPEGLLLKDIRCPYCEAVGLIITTGQILDYDA